MRFGFLCVAVAAIALWASACTQGVQTDINAGKQAENTGAESDLQQAAVAARTFLSTSADGAFTGFNAAAAQSVEPALRWQDGGAATTGVISIRGVSSTGAVLVTRSAGVAVTATGDVVCMGVTTTGDTMGKVDALTPEQCTGGW